MELKELSELADGFCDTIYEQNMSVAEITCLLALITNRINATMYRVMGAKVEVTTASAPVVKAPEVPKVKPKSIKYDPMYDPAPPMNTEHPPERIDSGKVIAPKNFACVCEACKKVVYVVASDIHDNCSVENFRTSFKPMEGVEPLPKTAEILNVDGKISTDCPSCGSNKSLYLTGGAR